MPHLSRIAAPALLLAALALSGCTATPSETPSTTAATCDVSVVVDYGVLDKDSVKECTEAGVATDVLAAVGITTKGTDDYGDQVICRVNDEPSEKETVSIEGQAPFVESCRTLNSVAYWALWVKQSADADWEYAQEGASTLELTAGQSVGLVYTAGTDSTPPQD